MAQKTIPAFTLISSIADTAQFLVDDGVQTYRCTAPQLYAYLFPKLSASRTISAAGNALASTDRVVLLNPTSASFSQALPALADMPTDFIVTLKNIATNGNTVTLDGDGSEQIDLVDTLVLGSDPVMDSVTLMKTATRWIVI